MEENKSLYDWLFNKSEAEIGLQKDIDNEIKRFESLPETVKHNKILNALYEELNEAAQFRRALGRSRRKQINPEKTKDTEDILKATSELKEKRVREISGPIKEILEKYNNLSKKEKRELLWRIEQEDGELYKKTLGDELDPFENPITTEKNIKELQYILVQTILDFINDNGLTDIDRVSFSADGLQASAEYGEWSPETDSYIGVEGLQSEDPNDENTWKVRRFIGKSI